MNWRGAVISVDLPRTTLRSIAKVVKRRSIRVRPGHRHTSYGIT